MLSSSQIERTESVISRLGRFASQEEQVQDVSFFSLVDEIQAVLDYQISQKKIHFIKVIDPELVGQNICIKEMRDLFLI